MGWLRKILRIEPGVALGWWLYERIIAGWPFLLSLLSGGVMTWASQFTDWIAPWGPAGWLAAGLATFLIVWGGITLIRMGASWKRSKDQIERFTERHLSSASINPLQRDFTSVRVNAWDFYHPYFEQNEEKTFRNCEVMGPCNILLNGNSQLPRARLKDCEVVIIDPAKGMKGVVAFKDCSFIDCSFYRVTFYMRAEMARDVKRQIMETGRFDGNEPLHVITDGNYGEI